jgi:hypothetical protein
MQFFALPINPSRNGGSPIKRLWGMIKEWLGLHLTTGNSMYADGHMPTPTVIYRDRWRNSGGREPRSPAVGEKNLSIEAWWSKIASKGSPRCKAMASLTMLVSWTVWKERNVRVFNNKSAPPTILLDIIKSETKLWLAMGSKHFSYVIPGE